MQPSSSWIRLVRGTVVIRRTSRLSTLLILVVSLLAAWEIYVVSTSIFARRVPATGEIVAKSSSIQIVASQSGVLTGELPLSGQSVLKQESLFFIRSSDASTADYDALEKTANRKRKEEEEGLIEVQTLRKNLIENRDNHLKTLGKEQHILRTTLVSQQKSIDVMKARVDALDLSKELFSPREMESARLELLDAKERYSRSEAELLQVEQRRHNANENLQQRLAELKERERNLRLQLVELDSNKQKRQRTEESRVLSPSSGRVSAVLIGAGQAVRQGQVLAIIDSEDEQVEQYSVRLSLSPKSIGAIEIGSEVWVEVEPFPAREFGLFLGKVTSIAHMNPQQADSDPSFLVEASLTPKLIEQFGKTVELRNGMSVKADVITDRLTILEWILEPVLVTLSKQNSL